MADPREQTILDYFRRSRETLERAAGDREFMAAILAIADKITRALRDGGKVMLAGNGGSAADAQHIAAEWVWMRWRPRYSQMPASGSNAFAAARWPSDSRR